jgi:cysteinyl-tRNA synthetase
MEMLKLYNNLAKKTEIFKPTEDMMVKMYTCGPSTYQRAHIGNYRTFLFEDILQRYLEYLGYKVTRLITLTNIEDKAIMSAEAANLSVDQLTSRNEAVLFKEFEKLRIKRPDYSVRASTIVDQSVNLIKTLIDKGIAYNFTYQSAKNVYFDPQRFPGFGRLAHIDLKKWPKTKRRFHLDTYPGMPWNKGDFILWHGCRERDRVCWDADLGRGRPAWNIQDAAMVTKHLGFSIDISCGGIDNLVRHHDYTLAIAEAVSGKPFARFWLHGGHLYVNGKKMSKSKGNVLYPDDLIVKGYRDEHIRFFLVYADYQQKRNFTWKNMAEQSRKLDSFREMVTDLHKAKSNCSDPKAGSLANTMTNEFRKFMNNNLDVKGAFDALHEIVSCLHKLMQEDKLNPQNADIAITCLREIDQVFQVIF